MVDGEGKFNTSHAHVAGLRRLSRRANTHRRQALSFSDYGRAAIHSLAQKRVDIAPGLSEEEFERIETLFRFTFPPDLTAVLREGLPVGVGFPDWRYGSVSDLRRWMNQPIAGLRSEAEQCGFWWGPRTDARDGRTALKRVPTIVPLYGNCFISVQPSQAGNPIFFIHKKQIWYCALDVADFFGRFDFNSAEIATVRSQDDLEGSLRPTDDPYPYSRKEAESQGILENWGRNLDAMGRNSACLSRRVEISRSTDSATGEEFVAMVEGDLLCGSSNSSSSGKNDDADQGPYLSSESLVQFSELDSTLAGKIARRIEFWSDLADRRRGLTLDSESPATTLMEERESPTQFRGSFVPKWLALIANDISVRLRKGGWREDEISEIMDCFSLPSTSGMILSLDTRSASENLTLQLEFLSSRLRKGGWSIEDVAEALLLDLAPADRTVKACAKISPELAARIVSLTQFTVDS